MSTPSWSAAAGTGNVVLYYYSHPSSRFVSAPTQNGPREKRYLLALTRRVSTCLRACPVVCSWHQAALDGLVFQAKVSLVLPLHPPSASSAHHHLHSNNLIHHQTRLTRRPYRISSSQHRTALHRITATRRLRLLRYTPHHRSCATIHHRHFPQRRKKPTRDFSACLPAEQRNNGTAPRSVTLGATWPRRTLFGNQHFLWTLRRRISSCLSTQLLLRAPRKFLFRHRPTPSTPSPAR
jgi:hypothetical protein